MASFDRNQRTIIGTVLAIVLFLALNSLVADLWRSKRLDLTEARLFTLSEGTRTVLAGLDEPIRLRLFISQDLVARAPQLAAYSARVQEMLQAYARMSENKLLLEIVHPQPFSDDEDQAVGLGVNQITVGGSQPIFFGLAATNSTDGKGAIPVFSPERETHLEYDLTRLVAELGQRGKGRLVLYDGIGLAGNPMARAPAQQVLQQMRQFFEITTIYGDVDELPKDTRVLMIVHPQQLSARTRFTIDQWVMNGGATLIFVDPNAETQLGPQPGVPAQEPASDLPDLFKAWGIGFDVGLAVGDPVYALRSQRLIGGREIEVSTYPWLALRDKALAADDVVMSDLSTILLTTTGSLGVTRDEVRLRPLLTASAQAGLLDAAEAGRTDADPRAMLGRLKPPPGPPVLAARVEGELASAFAGGAPEGAPAGVVVQARSVAPPNLVVFADADLLMDRNWIQVRQVMGQPMPQAFANNGDLVLNTVEQMAGGAVLAGLRGRGVFWRPLERIAALEREAQARFLEKERQLTVRLQETEAKLRSANLQAGEGSELLSGERARSIENFRSTLLSTRAELRDVQFRLRHDVDQLKTWITALNVGVWPVFVGAVLLLLSLRSRRRELPVRRESAAGGKDR